METVSTTSPTPRTLRKGQFCWLDTSIVMAYGPQIGANGIAVYCALATHASHATQTCFPSIKRIASLVHLSRATVKRTLRVLEKHGLVDTQARQDGEGDPTSNLYTLLDPTVQMLPQQDTPEEGRLTATLPPVTTEPTGRVPQSPEPDPLQPEARTSNPVDYAGEKGKQTTPAPRYDEALSWNKRAVLPSMSWEDRPDAQLAHLGLSEHETEHLRTRAIARLIARGLGPDLRREPIIHAEMLVVYEEEWAPCAHLA
jgi:DNA-binding transcriptional ArsR family regulator